jgi:hypothetical protein
LKISKKLLPTIKIGIMYRKKVDEENIPGTIFGFFFELLMLFCGLLEFYIENCTANSRMPKYINAENSTSHKFYIKMGNLKFCTVDFTAKLHTQNL